VPHDSIVTLEERQLKILKKKSAAASHGDFQI
jgi:hypothetical protein